MPVLGGLGGSGPGGVPPWAGGLGGVQLGGGFGNEPAPAPFLCVDAVVAESTNSLLVTYSVPVDMSLGPNGARNPANYTLTPVDPPDAFVPLIQFIEQVSDVTVRILFDAPFTPDATYRLTSVNILSLDCNPIDLACNTGLVDTLDQPRAPDAIRQQADEFLDLANPQITEDRKQWDGGLGTYQRTDTGDYALEANPEYLRKRVIRRATTGLGDFFHLPNYGFGQPIKGRIAPGQLRRIQAQAIRQIKQEPDVVAALVRVRQANEATPTILILDIRVRTADGRDHDFTAPLDYGALS